MNSQFEIPGAITSITKGDRDHDHDHDHARGADDDHDHDQHQDHDCNNECQSSVVNTNQDTECVPDNNPPDSFWVSQTKVTDWLDQHTYIERKASVKLVTISRNFDPTQQRSSQRSFSFNHKPKTGIIGFVPPKSQKPNHHAEKSKQNDKPDKVRLFRNRSEPGRDYVTQVNEPVSPKVSCIGRVGPKRGRGRRTGFWKSVKAAFSNRKQGREFRV